MSFQQAVEIGVDKLQMPKMHIGDGFLKSCGKPTFAGFSISVKSVGKPPSLNPVGVGALDDPPYYRFSISLKSLGRIMC